MKKKFIGLMITLLAFIPICIVKANSLPTEGMANSIRESLDELGELKEYVDATMGLIITNVGDHPELEGIGALFDPDNYVVTPIDGGIIIMNNGLDIQTTIDFNNSIYEYNYVGNKNVVNFREYYFNSIMSYLLEKAAYNAKGYDPNVINAYIIHMSETTLADDGIEVTPIIFNDGQNDEIEAIDKLKIDITKLTIPASQTAPVVTISDVTSNSLNVSASWSSSTSSNQWCMIYGAQENDNFQYITTLNCNEIQTTFTLNDLEPNTVYKIKAVGEGFSNFGEVVEVRTNEIKQEYNLSSGKEYSITFYDSKGKEFDLAVTPATEHIKKYEKNKEELEKAIYDIKEAVKDHGEYIEWYEIIVKEGNTPKTNGEFKFKIKITDEMKKYDTFEMINIETKDDKIEENDIVKMKLEGDYLIGELPHLSHYVLVGKKTDNPGTGVSKYTMPGVILLLGTFGIYVIYKKKIEI